MVTIITELSKYAMILSLAIYTVLGFRLVRRNEAGKKAALWQQNVLMFGMQFLGNLTLYLSTENEKILLFYIAQLGAFILFLVLQRVIYPNADQLLNHNMLLLLSVGLLMLARLSFDKAARQAELAALAAAELKRYSYDGYAGRITAFLQPYAAPCMVAEIEDEVYHERDGRYYIEGVETTYGTGGARRTVEIGIKI